MVALEQGQFVESLVLFGEYGSNSNTNVKLGGTRRQQGASKWYVIRKRLETTATENVNKKRSRKVQ